MTKNDYIWIELNSKFDLTLYIINPGEDVLVPFFYFPNTMTMKHLSSNLAWTNIMLTKETKEVKKSKYGTCNDDDGYVYGGRQTML